MKTTLSRLVALPACGLFMLFLLALALQVDAQTGGSDSLTLVHANLIDGISNAPLMDATVVVVNGHIQSIGHEAASGQSTVIDLKGHWLLPGFVDAHVHVADLAAARRALRSGATTVGEAGVNHFADIGMRELNHKGVVDVPDVVAAGYHIRTHPADDYFLDFPQDADLLGGVRGTDNVRRMVREMASRGVNRIKVMATERAGLPDTDPRIRIFNDDELAAIVDEANKAGLWTVAHAHGDEGAAAAVRAGVHCIEHGTYLSDDTLRLMKEKGVYLDPTVTATVDMTDPEGEYDDPVLQMRGRAMLPIARELVGRAWKMGIKIVAATDTTYFAKNNRTMADEIIELAGDGLPPMDAIKAGTSASAEELGVDKRTGSIRAGYEADFVIVGRNPLEDIRHIADVLMVVNNGRVALNRMNVAPRP
ncbi:MAG: amidohydrolase family protein [Acidobacteriia bacterium]|nr:amidohydrolase family protein [Terriglobia bacterium]